MTTDNFFFSPRDWFYINMTLCLVIDSTYIQHTFTIFMILILSASPSLTSYKKIIIKQLIKCI